MTPAIADQAIEILQQTHDGNDLDPSHLKLVELAVNGCLNDAGKGAFADLLANVRGGYVKPWFHSVEHITRDHDGYVLWKGKPVEHTPKRPGHTPKNCRAAAASSRLRALRRMPAASYGGGRRQHNQIPFTHYCLNPKDSPIILP